MTPEQWAKELKERVKYSVNGDAFEQYVAGVIREAENAAYERAAQVADDHKDNERSEFASGYDAASERIAAAIRKLKGEGK